MKLRARYFSAFISFCNYKNVLFFRLFVILITELNFENLPPRRGIRYVLRVISHSCARKVCKWRFSTVIHGRLTSLRRGRNTFFVINLRRQINTGAWLKFTGELFSPQYITTNWRSSISPSKCIIPKSRSAWRASALRFAHVNATKLEFLREEKLSRSRETYARGSSTFSLSHLHFLLDVAAENSAVSLYRKAERERMIVMVGVRGRGVKGEGWGGRGKEKCRLKICGGPSTEGASARKLGPGRE